MSSHTDLCAVLAGNDYFITEILVILYEHRIKYCYVHNNDKKHKKFSLWHSSEFGLLYYSPTQNDQTYWNASLQFKQHGFPSCTFNRSIWVEKTFILASPHATTVCFMGRPWSRTQFESRCEKRKHWKRQVVYLKLVRQLAHFPKIFKAQFYANSREECCMQNTDYCVYDKSALRFPTLRLLS